MLVEFDFLINDQYSKNVDDIIGSPQMEDLIRVDENQTVTFVCTSMNKELLDKTKDWDFGDGDKKQSTSKKTFHNYSTGGKFQIELCIENIGCLKKHIYVMPQGSMESLVGNIKENEIDNIELMVEKKTKLTPKKIPEPSNIVYHNSNPTKIKSSSNEKTEKDIHSLIPTELLNSSNGDPFDRGENQFKQDNK